MLTGFVSGLLGEIPMITESINYLKDSENGAMTVLVGGLLTLLSFLIVPAFFVTGYLVRVLDRTAEGETEAPSFDDWGALLVDGVKSFVIALVYLIVPIALAAVFVGGGGGLIALGGDSGVASAFGALGILVGSILTLVVGLAIWYVLPAALANFAQDRRMGSAFAFGEIAPVLRSGKYATAWLLGLLVIVVAGIVGGALSTIIPLIGGLAALFLSFYAQVMAFYIYGRAYGDVMGMTMPEEPGITGEQPVV